MAEPADDRGTVMVKKFDRETWRAIRAEAQARRWETAALLEHVWREWRACQNGAHGGAS